MTTLWWRGRGVGIESWELESGVVLVDLLTDWVGGMGGSWDSTKGKDDVHE